MDGFKGGGDADPSPLNFCTPFFQSFSRFLSDCCQNGMIFHFWYDTHTFWPFWYE